MRRNGVGKAVGHNARAADKQRNANVRLVQLPLVPRHAKLAQVLAVVYRRDNVGRERERGE